MVLVPY